MPIAVLLADREWMTPFFRRAGLGFRWNLARRSAASLTPVVRCGTSTCVLLAPFPLSFELPFSFILGIAMNTAKMFSESGFPEGYAAMWALE